ncbi:hypothetical protein EK21DRAFT_113027 [Setomelanomma holmii]|uniref:Uncharacterized protein n=1 Tax=Setomelanomma holmii TaxID=210430 RepID=A0A9P4LMV1_9PLEO|nr:hypothetical protein EK21DRAFT_113027 [Setomelanomma holmii]
MTHMLFHAPQLLKLELVDKEMYELASEIYYKHNTFVFSYSQTLASSTFKVRYPTAQVGQLIRNVELVIHLRGDFPSLDGPFGLLNYPDMLALLRPKRARYIRATSNHPLYLQSNAEIATRNSEVADTWQRVYVWSSSRNCLQAWQHLLPILHHLTVHVTIDRCLSMMRRELLRELSNSAKCFLRSKNVRVIVHMEKCQERSHPMRAMCDGQCGAILKQAIEYLLGG